jgi:hypothetical protein
VWRKFLRGGAVGVALGFKFRHSKASVRRFTQEDFMNGRNAKAIARSRDADIALRAQAIALGLLLLPALLLLTSP